MSSELPNRAVSSPADAKVRCTIAKIAGIDHEGRPIFGERIEEPCAVLKLPGDDMDISGKIGSAPDYVTKPRCEDAVLLLRVTTKANVNDVIEIAGMSLKVTTISSSYDSVGKVAFHVVQATLYDVTA